MTANYEISQSETDTTDSLKKQKLFNDETYNLLMESQQSIYEKTGIRITLRKILDKLITAESIDILVLSCHESEHHHYRENQCLCNSTMCKSS